MFHSIRRHQKWLWAVVTTLTIVSFVMFFAPKRARYQKMSLFSREAPVGSINGRSINREEYIDAYREAQLRYRMSTGEWPRNDEMSRQLGTMDREVRNRIFFIEKLKDLDVKVSDASIAQWISEVFQDREQHVFRKEDFDHFAKVILPEQNISMEDFERFARHEVGIQHLISVTGLSGRLITAQDAEIIYRRENEQVDTQSVFLATTNYLAKVTVDPAALMTFYTNQQANYRIPDRVQVVYVKFEATNFLAQANQRLSAQTNLAQLIDSTYAERGANAFKDTNNLPLPAEAAKQKIREEFRHSFGLVEARKKAIEFANKLLELPPGTNNLANLAAAEGIVSKITEPFTEESAPPSMKVPDMFNKAAFQLSPAQSFYEQPIVAEDAVYLIGYNKRIPSEIKPFESIREHVTEEFRKNRATALLLAAGRDLCTKITNSVAQGKTFEAACKEAGVQMIEIPAFSQKTPMLAAIPNRGDFSALKTAAFALTPGKVSQFTSTRDGGLIVYLKAKVPVEDGKLKAEMPEFLDKLRRDRQFEAFGEWFRKEMELAKITLPSDKQSAN